MGVYAGKIRHAWPLILRNSFKLLWRFRPRIPGSAPHRPG